MCMIIGETDDILNTNIIVSKIINKINKKEYQRTVYSNKVYSKKPVAMVLPYKNKNVTPLIIETNKDDNHIFESIENCFSTSRTRISFMSDNDNDNDNVNFLKIFRSGNYRYSLVNSIDDLKKIDNGIFKIKEDLHFLLNDYINLNFGFIVCIIDKNVDYTLFSYISDLVNNEFFIPTKHYHENNLKLDTISHDWHNEIYIIGANDKDKHEDKDYTKGILDLDLKNFKYSISEYLEDSVCKKENLLKITKYGSFSNMDIVISAF